VLFARVRAFCTSLARSSGIAKERVNGRLEDHFGNVCFDNVVSIGFSH